MKIALIIIAALVVLVILFVVWRIVATILGSQRRTARILKRIEPVVEAIHEQREPPSSLVRELAADASTRRPLHDILAEHDLLRIFPAAHRTAEALAESDMVFWLCHPNELGSPPDEIELVQRVARDSETALGEVDWYLFRYRTHPPHWAADDGWMAGVAGPYPQGVDPLPVPSGTFSRFEGIDAMTPEQHVEHCHELTRRNDLYAMMAEAEAERA